MFAAAVGTNCSPQVVEAQKKLEKTKKAQVLSNFLKGSVIFRKKEGASTLTPADPSSRVYSCPLPH